MKTYLFTTMLWLWISASSFADLIPSIDLEPKGVGSFNVGSTNMEVADEFMGIGDKAMHEILLGRSANPNQSKFITDILKHPESSWSVDVDIPNTPAMYAHTSGKKLTIPIFVTFPTSPKIQSKKYSFPYFKSTFGVFENMLDKGESPVFADPKARYPLIIQAHGSQSHPIYGTGHAHKLARHGYIVASIFYGDDRSIDLKTDNSHLPYLRPLITKTIIDSLVSSKAFGENIDNDNVGVSGHSFGGFTGLAIAGGEFQGNSETVHDSRVKASVLAAPWVGHSFNGQSIFAFGKDNIGLRRVSAPMLWLFGTNDKATPSSYILPASKQTSGPNYVVELVGQPHIFEKGSWEDRDGWELLFFDAYLKKDATALKSLKIGRSMKGGNEDIQLFEYQK